MGNDPIGCMTFGPYTPAPANDGCGTVIVDTASLAAENKRLRDRIEALEAADAWRPIESAPRDGSMILLGRFIAQDPCLCVGCWNVHPKEGEGGLNGFNAWMDGATHWRALPAPPASAKGDG